MRALLIVSLLMGPMAWAQQQAPPDSGSLPSWVEKCADRLESLRLQFASSESILKLAHVERRSPIVRLPEGPVQGFVVELKAGDETKRFYYVTISTRHDLAGRPLPRGWLDETNAWRPHGPPIALLLKRFENGYSAWIQINAPSSRAKRFARAAQSVADACLEAAWAEPHR
jgi:hypothetical protein